jgi:hypothetical protein
VLLSVLAVPGLLDRLQASETGEQAAALLARLPAAEHFEGGSVIAAARKCKGRAILDERVAGSSTSVSARAFPA